LGEPLGRSTLTITDRIELTTGGLVSNAGIALARWGVATAAVACLGNDAWAETIRRQYQSAGLSTDHLEIDHAAGTSATLVLVDPSGERSFIFQEGASARLTAERILKHRELFRRCQWVLYGYYSLFPNQDRELPALFAELRRIGCRVALDTAGHGGDLEPLSDILPHVDLYLPNLHEARHQCGDLAVDELLDCYRRLGCTGILGVKLGAQGALLSPAGQQRLVVPSIEPPGAVLDTTGAGDAFDAGLIAGLIRGHSVSQASRIAAAAGACCVTALGATPGLRPWLETVRLARLEDVPVTYHGQSEGKDVTDS
jgi:sugar/nucleoside kinase (ribokinase family)